MCRQSLRLRGLEGVRCFGRLHHSHQGQYQNERGREPDGGGLAEQDSPGKEMVSGADDFVVDQAPESAYSLGEEGRKLAGSCSACLRPHLAQSDGFRIESKQGLVVPQVMVAASATPEPTTSTPTIATSISSARRLLIAHSAF